MTCSGKAPYMARNFTPLAFGSYRVDDPPSSLGHSSGAWVCVMWNSIFFSRCFYSLAALSPRSRCPTINVGKFVGYSLPTILFKSLAISRPRFPSLHNDLSLHPLKDRPGIKSRLIGPPEAAAVFVLFFDWLVNE